MIEAIIDIYYEFRDSTP